MTWRCLSARLTLGTLAALLAGLAIGCGGGSSSTPSNPAAPGAALPNLDQMLAEKSMGSTTAPITMIEYSSLTCPHCATFHVVTLPLIKSAYVDTGKVRLIYRDFPLESLALTASMAARCARDSYFTAIDRLYRSQSTWAYATDVKSAIKALLAPAGLSSADIDACLASADLQNGIQGIASTGRSQYGLTATPTFIINGEKIVGALPFSDFDAAFKRLGG